ncbi:hypothetical protein Plhal703r1_c07g0039221 [Plasmopara halstedii]
MLNVLPNKVVPDVYVLCTCVIARVVCQSYRTLIVFPYLRASHLFLTHVLEHCARPKYFLCAQA